MTAGFIVGFDSETQSVADAMVELIEEAAIPVCMVGLLYALPNTQLTRRLEKEGRLHPHPEREDLKSADQCTMGLNFETLRPRQEILADYVHILDRIYDPAAFAGRLQRLAEMLDNSGRKQQIAPRSIRKHSYGSLDVTRRIIANLPEPRAIFRRALMQCISSNPDFDPQHPWADGSLSSRRTIFARRHRPPRNHDGRTRNGCRTADAG